MTLPYDIAKSQTPRNHCTYCNDIFYKNTLVKDKMDNFFVPQLLNRAKVTCQSSSFILYLSLCISIVTPSINIYCFIVISY